MRTHTWMLLIGLAGCDSSFRRVGPGLEPNFTDTDTGDDTAAGDKWLCDNRQVDGSCIGYFGVGWDEDAANEDCDSVPLQGRCPDANVGTCRFDDGLPKEYLMYYYIGPFYSDDDARLLEGDCTRDGGSWIAATR